VSTAYKSLSGLLARLSRAMHATYTIRFSTARSQLAALALDGEDLDLEKERSAGRNAPGGETTLTVALVRGDAEVAGLTDVHPQATLVPAGDHLADASLVGERLLSGILRRPEFLHRLLDGAGGVHGHGVALGDDGTGAGGEGLLGWWRSPGWVPCLRGREERGRRGLATRGLAPSFVIGFGRRYFHDVDRRGWMGKTDRGGVPTCSGGESTGSGSFRDDGARAQTEQAWTGERVGHVTVDTRRVMTVRAERPIAKTKNHFFGSVGPDEK